MAVINKKERYGFVERVLALFAPPDAKTKAEISTIRRTWQTSGAM